MEDTALYAHLDEVVCNYGRVLAQASEAIIDNEVSNYPIFVMHKEALEIGVPLIEQIPGGWSLKASTLEEFSSKQLIRAERIDEFRSVYKPTGAYFCFFVLTEDMANFVFAPRNPEQIT